MKIPKGSGCITPIPIKLERPRFSRRKDGISQQIYSVDVACGKCGPCIKRRVNQWAFRLTQEDRRSVSAYFTTLTYDTEHVPLTPRCNMTLCKKDLQDFFKRLRYYHEKDGLYLSEIQNGIKVARQPIKYYACGEYGGLFGRPHYHAIIFNCFPDTIDKAWSECIIKPNPQCPEGVFKPIGNVLSRPADTASIFYTLKYMDKRESDEYSYDPDIVKEFSLKSKGLGDNYICDESLIFHSSNLDNNFVASGIHKIALPRFYNRKFWPDSKDEDGRTIPHPHKTALLFHIKQLVSKEQDRLRESEGILHEHMNIIRNNSKNISNISYRDRLF